MFYFEQMAITELTTPFFLAELTTHQAADILGVSELSFVKLVESGEISSQKINSQYRVSLNAVLTYQEKMVTKRLATVDELVRESQRLNLY